MFLSRDQGYLKVSLGPDVITSLTTDDDLDEESSKVLGMLSNSYPLSEIIKATPEDVAMWEKHEGGYGVKKDH